MVIGKDPTNNPRTVSNIPLLDSYLALLYPNIMSDRIVTLPHSCHSVMDTEPGHRTPPASAPAIPRRLQACERCWKRKQKVLTDDVVHPLCEANPS